MSFEKAAVVARVGQIETAEHRIEAVMHRQGGGLQLLAWRHCLTLQSSSELMDKLSSVVECAVAGMGDRIGCVA